jgi:hypothetical protein
MIESKSFLHMKYADWEHEDFKSKQLYVGESHEEHETNHFVPSLQ